MSMFASRMVFVGSNMSLFCTFAILFIIMYSIVHLISFPLCICFHYIVVNIYIVRSYRDVIVLANIVTRRIGKA